LFGDAMTHSFVWRATIGTDRKRIIFCVCLRAAD
jgi:hypothetical protein